MQISQRSPSSLDQSIRECQTWHQGSLFMPENTEEAETNNTQTLYKILICNIYECNTRKKERKIQYHK
jgi:hypothetical protein